MEVLIGLAIFSGLTMNLLVHFCLGFTRIESPRDINLAALGFSALLLAATVLGVYVIFSLVLETIGLGFLALPLILPVTVLIYNALAKALQKGLSRASGSPDAFPDCDALVVGAAFLTLLAASNFLEALFLASGFALGSALAMLILREIEKKSQWEPVPKSLRGTPITLISMGLLSFIFGAVSSVFLRALF
jgi:electron transport complex protein RnfA